MTGAWPLMTFRSLWVHESYGHGASGRSLICSNNIAFYLNQCDLCSGPLRGKAAWFNK